MVSRREFLSRLAAITTLLLVGGTKPQFRGERVSLGLNILGDRGVPHREIIDQVRMLNAHYNLVMNNIELTAEVSSYCRKAVIFRWWELDDNAHQHTDPREFIRFRHNLIAHIPNALIYAGNEPYASREHAEWTYIAMDEAEKLNRRLVICNFSTGNPPEAALTYYKNVFNRAIDRGHVLGLHEYFSKDWRADYTWHVGRFLEIYRFLGGRLPETVMTEIGEARGFHPLRGYRWGSDALTDDEYGRNLREMAAMYNEYGIHALVFARTNEREEDDWRTFNPRPRVIEIMAAYNAGEKPIENQFPPLPAANDSRWVWVSATANNIFVNVRSTPVVAGVKNKIGEIRTNTPIKIILDPKAGYPEGAGVWRPVILPDGTRGWARDDVYKYDFLTWHTRKLKIAHNLRETPNGKLIRTILADEVISVAFPVEPVRAGSYEWVLVLHDMNTVGWMALTQPSIHLQFATLPPDLDEPIRLLADVPYVSQWGHASGRTSMCGAASAWMIIAADRKRKGVLLPKEITVDTVANYMGLTKSSFATTAQIETALEAYGVPAEVTLSLTTDKIREELDNGYPVLVLFDYGHISQRKDKSFVLGHFVVAVGYTDHSIIFHDPDYTKNEGAFIHYSIEDVEKALSQTTFSGNRPNQGLIIREYQKPEF